MPPQIASNCLAFASQSVMTVYSCCCCCFSLSAHWLPTRKKLLYTVANPARGLLKKKSGMYNIYNTVLVLSGYNNSITFSGFPIGAADIAWGVLGSVQSTRLLKRLKLPTVTRGATTSSLSASIPSRLSLPLPVLGGVVLFFFPHPRGQNLHPPSHIVFYILPISRQGLV